MKDILIFLLGAVVVKLIDDNLPSLHYKNLAAGFEKHIVPFFTYCLPGLFIPHCYNYPQQRGTKNYTQFFAFALAVLIISKAIEHKKQAAA